jgi:hypothetical protein
MPLSELPMAFMVGLFLAIFVLIGIYPTVKRGAESLRKFIHVKTPDKDPFGQLLEKVHSEIFSSARPTGPLNDFEIIVLRRIALAKGKPLSRKQVNEPLLFGDQVLQKTLHSLGQRGLIQIKVSSLFGKRFVLSAAGRKYALDQGYLIELRGLS